MSPASRVAHTTDILHSIFSHISAGNDLASLLRTSPLFFGLIARKLYRSLPISNVLNPFSGVNAGGRGGPYGKAKLARTAARRSVWEDWYEYPPLLTAETVIIHPADRKARQESGYDLTLPYKALIRHLCSDATRLHLSTPYITAGAKGIETLATMPSLPCVETLVMKANAGEIGQLTYVVGDFHYTWDCSHEAHPPCFNIEAVHILLWGDLVYPEEELESPAWDEDRLHRLAVATNANLESKIFHKLCELALRLGARFNTKKLWLYNADRALERLSWKRGKSAKVDTFKARVEKRFLAGFGAGSQVFWRTGREFYEAFGDLSARDKTEEWYHTAVLAPSAKLVSLRDRLAAKTKFPADTFVGLTEQDAERALETFKSN
ncbi:hypothetical protein I350_07537 [Cryptococcus amylolentus CBS 6273]|uniref:Uncharacterized protein n=1 Tax=Cryptococcus amylolentus CBS 6273 TaxID=1296118 RepID=A0A1E3JAM4_9TREE|nr:hypothetical protein I350_07537 [Cryptococcus amylolentus CBS 6273]